LPWALASLGAAAGAALVRNNPQRLMDPATPITVACGALAAIALAGAVLGRRSWPVLAPLVAAARLAIVLLLVGVWRGEARELWGALAVWVAWRDADEGLAGERPLLPVALGLVLALAWHTWHPIAPAARAVAVALVAALAASRADGARREGRAPADRLAGPGPAGTPGTRG
jgi:hypothetical protein